MAWIVSFEFSRTGVSLATARTASLTTEAAGSSLSTLVKLDWLLSLSLENMGVARSDDAVVIVDDMALSLAESVLER